MPWTPEQKVEYLLRLPWSIVPDRDGDDILIRTRELPSAVGCGDTPDAADADFWDSLRETLWAYVVDGDNPPKPIAAPQRFPWEMAGPAASTVFVVRETPRHSTRIEVMQQTASTRVVRPVDDGALSAV